MKSKRRIFLSAQWRYLAMLNYEIDPVVLAPFVPKGTELDQWSGKTFVSVVGFLFQNAKLGRFSVPFHRNFEEVNLRFYVRRLSEGEWRRGVVFIKELVPRRAIAWTARRFYNENYLALPMSHEIRVDAEGGISGISYDWTFKGRASRLQLMVAGDPATAGADSQEEFITEHYWGYARQPDGGTLEYQVEHPKWRVWAAQSARLECDAKALYGDGFAAALERPPHSAFLAEGSAVTVRKGKRVE
jgi:uncharacterized protein YqjF (DUF2071 family)